MTSETTLVYEQRSVLDADGLALATSGGRSAHPFFFRGFVEHAEQAARAILAVAEVSESRYFDPAWRSHMKDPVVTSNRTVVRFESFSQCNGVYARLDIDGDDFDSEVLDWGTTNVDLNTPVRKALAGVAPGEPLRLSVGVHAVAVETLEAAAIEVKVPLPERWLRGFAETQIAASTMRPVATLRGAAARDALRALPRLKTSQGAPWVSFGRTGPRATSTASAETVCLLGPQRLGALSHVVNFASALTVFAPELRPRLALTRDARTEFGSQPSGWVVEMENARLTLIISPEPYRGFSGEGGVLASLATVDRKHVEVVERELCGQAMLDPVALGDAVGLDAAAVAMALTVLGAAGRVGFDFTSGHYFHRDLPYDRTALAEFQPRLRDARALVDARAVTALGVNRDSWDVASAGATYRVTFSADGERCNCAWFARHRGERGPCKHVLAAKLERDAAELAL